MTAIDSALLIRLSREAGLRQPSIVLQKLAPAGPPIELAALRPLYPASMIKVPIAAALTERWAREEIAPSDTVRIAAADMTANDLPSPLVPGYVATTDELCRSMLTRSDNVATNALIQLLGRERITAFAHRRGLEETYVRRKLSGSLPLIADPEADGRNAHPAADAAHMLGQIATRAIPGADYLEETLLAQEWNDALSPGLLPGDQFAHKTGETDEVRHDGGILETPEGRRYVLVVYTALTEADGSEPLGAFMRLLRPHL